jgi:hypothetical protein
MDMSGKDSEDSWMAVGLGDDFSSGRTILWHSRKKSGRSRGTGGGMR